jgi:hypothetical protein
MFHAARCPGESPLRFRRQPRRAAAIAHQAGRAEIGRSVDHPGMAVSRSHAVVIGYGGLAGEADGLDEIEMHSPWPFVMECLP